MEDKYLEWLAQQAEDLEDMIKNPSPDESKNDKWEIPFTLGKYFAYSKALRKYLIATIGQKSN